MKKRLERVQSPQLGRAISLWSYGHWGPPLVVFPTAAGFAHSGAEDFGVGASVNGRHGALPG